MITILKIKDNEVIGWIFAKDIEEARVKAVSALQNTLVEELSKVSEPREGKTVFANGDIMLVDTSTKPITMDEAIDRIMSRIKVYQNILFEKADFPDLDKEGRPLWKYRYGDTGLANVQFTNKELREIITAFGLNR